MERREFEKLSACMKRAEKGEELTIGFLGGSITQGSLASCHENTYAYLVYRWWCRTFPKASFHYVNAGIGGTTSLFGAARAEEDLLMYRPDVVVVDFSVNDKAEEFFMETYEGLLRKLLKAPSAPAVLVVNHVYYDTGENAQRFHNALALYYQIPFVSMKDTVYNQMKKGYFTRDELTLDGLHPNDRGHCLAAEEITRMLERIRTDFPAIEEGKKTGLIPKPLTVNAYEYARCLNICNCVPVLAGFRADPEEKKGHLDIFKNGWIGRKRGDRLVLETECSCLAVLYRKTVQGPAPFARLVLDGKEERAALLDGNFEEDWGDCLYLESILHHGEQKKHLIEVELLENTGEGGLPFYLAGFISA